MKLHLMVLYLNKGVGKQSLHLLFRNALPVYG